MNVIVICSLCFILAACIKVSGVSIWPDSNGEYKYLDHEACPYIGNNKYPRYQKTDGNSTMYIYWVIGVWVISIQMCSDGIDHWNTWADSTSATPDLVAAGLWWQTNTARTDVSTDAGVTVTATACPTGKQGQV